jgi:exopolyphosphatase/guanosine-5'-triphosphate,3'-diphosphate pyrophosphatase
VPYESLAALDLGSNSFHMVVARRVERELRIVDRVRERVQLAAGLDDGQQLTQDAQERALACLTRMGQRLRDLAPDKVRAVGTNTLRKARNAREFLSAAQDALGHPIEVVSGREEARLIYLGVAHSVADDKGRRLVVDIGGGSTECILGERFEVLEADSLHMGCVSYSLRHFPAGELRRKHLRAAELAARLELVGLERRFRNLGWDTVVGASGTIRAVSEVLRASGWTEGEITPAGLRMLRKALLNVDRLDELSLPGLKSERAPVFVGGVAILQAIFESLGITCMTASPRALRDGVLFDLQGRIRHEDVRDRTIRRVVQQFNIDLAQASRVERTAAYVQRHVAEAWDMGGSYPTQILRWASRLHEVGMAVDYSAYHKHGSYLIRHSYLPGFSNDDKQRISALIRFHRRKVTGSDLSEFPSLSQTLYLRLAIILRLAVVLNRSRSPRPLPYFAIEVLPDGLRLTFPEEWLEEHPLTREDLEIEAGLLKGRHVRLEIALDAS